MQFKPNIYYLESDIINNAGLQTLISHTYEAVEEK